MSQPFFLLPFPPFSPSPITRVRLETMPYCETVKHQPIVDGDLLVNNGISLFYRNYGHGPTKVLLIIGLAGTHDSWGPQIKGLTGTEMSNDESVALDGEIGNERYGSGNVGGSGIEVCAFDNRGMGRSSIPIKKSEYSTAIMAKDAVALMDHLGWKKAHVFGHSMGAMVACKLAAMVPDRVLSLALLNVTGGGFECIPKLDRYTMSVALRFIRAKTPEQRAAVDLDTHYSKEYLDEYVGSNTRRAILYQEYVKGISASGMQSNFGFLGQVHACWTHKMTRSDFESIRSAGFLVSVVHGRHDIIAQVEYGRRIAEKLYPVAKMIELQGGHLVSHERTEEVNQALLKLIEASEMKISPTDWTNLPNRNSRYSGTSTEVSSSRASSTGESNVSFMYKVVERLQFALLYLFGVFMFAYEYARRGLRRLTPAQVGTSLT